MSLPKIYESHIPDALRKFLLSDEKVAVVFAPTGAGKTVACSRIFADTVKSLREKGVQCSGSVLMPYRVSVKEMYKYLLTLRKKHKETHSYGYGISGDTVREDGNHVVLQTVGYFLEGSVAATPNQKHRQLIMLDEAHDASWQTDFVLSHLMWRIKEGDNIKLVVSSATLDVQKIEKKYGVPTVNLIMQQEQKNHVVTFNEEKGYYPLDGSKVSEDFYKVMTRSVVNAYKTTASGHILVLMPGQEEITKLIEILTKHAEIDDKAVIIGLHSQLSKEDIQFAIDSPKEKDERKIIVSTNIVENAITINDLCAVVDSCLRKELYVDQDGVSELRLTLASQSNVIQAYGRCGRQGVQGHAFITIPKSLFETLTPYSLSEVERNPLYPQLIKCFKHKLPHLNLLSHAGMSKVREDIEYLEKYEMIRKDGETYALTETGAIISQLPCSIRAGRFIVKAVEYIKSVITDDKFGAKNANDIRSYFYYYTCLTAAWIGYGTSVFENAFRRPRETEEAFGARKEETEQMQADFYKADCYRTFLNVWFSSFTSDAKLHDWCRENKIFCKAIIEIDRASRDIAPAVTSRQP
ncbi:pre-mRNA-splicing factor ATP-dependent RNA helicase PRP16 [Yasminevirus sp. GU-2018]|uniref:Pre-mRNA-splicing factor ATP-dependent RNA helicase PRP16 n=1 Tax=Yasminevirus sp. GU-2018 TaxID=2420051 RepID=A0A5K0UBU1_9VIRU|nr:pre-mRNA-splicing factor ATP-dependent RNA helicase PRP16 [Yasminevirus sp. GU-2018]